MNGRYNFFAWSSGNSCIGPPSTIYQFDAQDKGPQVYRWLRAETLSDYGICGFSQISVGNGCCWKSMDASQFGYSSMMLSPLQIAPTFALSAENIPSAAMRSNYCKIHYNTNDGYPFTRYVLNDGTCQEGFTCRDGILSLYGSENCQVDVNERYDTSNNIATNSTILNSIVSVDYITIASALQKTVWTGLLPRNLNVIYLSSPLLIAIFVFILIALSATLITTSWISYKLYTKPSRRVVYQGLLISQILALTSSTLLLVFHFIPQNNGQTFENLSKSTHIFQSLVTLVSTINNVHMLAKIFSRIRDLQLTSREPLAYLAILAINIILIWPIFLPSISRLWISIGIFLWFFITLSSNFICLLAFAIYRFLKRIKEDGDEFPKSIVLVYIYMTNNIFATLLLLFSLVNIFAYTLIFCISNFTVYLGDDTLYNLFQIFAWIPIIWDAMISVWLFEMTTGAIKDKSIKDLFAWRAPKVDGDNTVPVPAIQGKKKDENTVKLTVIPPPQRLELLFINEGKKKKRKNTFFGGNDVDLLLNEIIGGSPELETGPRSQRGLRGESIRSVFKKFSRPVVEEVDEPGASYKVKLASEKHIHQRSEGSYRFGYAFNPPESSASVMSIKRSPNSHSSVNQKSLRQQESMKSKLSPDSKIIESRVVESNAKSKYTDVVSSPTPLSPEEEDKITPLKSANDSSVYSPYPLKSPISFQSAPESKRSTMKKKNLTFMDF